MIRYIFYKGIEGKAIYLESDEKANELSKFLNADKWKRDTILFVDLSKDIKYRVEIEIGENNLDILSNLKIIDVKTWQ
jgi:hypothetical protein